MKRNVPPTTTNSILVVSCPNMCSWLSFEVIRIFASYPF